MALVVLHQSITAPVRVGPLLACAVTTNEALPDPAVTGPTESHEVSVVTRHAHVVAGVVTEKFPVPPAAENCIASDGEMR